MGKKQIAEVGQNVETSIWQAAKWLNKPSLCQTYPDHSLEVFTDLQTDFWRETHYGFVRDSGHFLGFETTGGFTAQVRINAEFHELYDQAGIMVRLNEQTWLKAGIEYNDGRPMISSVLTQGKSDWATGCFAGDPNDFWLRLTVSDGVLRLQYSTEGMTWPLLRLAPFPEAQSYTVGPMCCTPQRQGLRVRFSEWSLSQPLGRDLHDLS
ncbi:regulation of enolase 1 [Pseudomonas cedrina subsp. cedrina]|uniref:Regulation of enolase 1 n=1 Tax=Pseudomonas cedrina subsp. cedrina TaxID=76762 RepID=A0A1V2K2X4_PSECE|nr:regulation of enolase 1 [Pseudomonas cedrina subsp. cedrina]